MPSSASPLSPIRKYRPRRKETARKTPIPVRPPIPGKFPLVNPYFSPVSLTSKRREHLSFSAMMASEDQQKRKPMELSAPSAAVVPVYCNTEWAPTMQAYYAAGAAVHPYAWSAQHIMASPYGAGFPPMFPHHSAFYPHPATMSAAHHAEDGAAAEGNASPNAASKSDESGSNSAETRNEQCDQKDQSMHKLGKGHTSDADRGSAAMPESLSVPLKGVSATNLPVSAPGRAMLPSSATKLNIGMDIWNNSHQLAVTTSSASTLEVSARDGLRLQQLDERQLRKEKRKQSNRESARRSRLRRQLECEELAKKVGELTGENNFLREEIEHLKKACEEMEAANAKLGGQQVWESHGSGALTFSISTGTSVPPPFDTARTVIPVTKHYFGSNRESAGTAKAPLTTTGL